MAKELCQDCEKLFESKSAKAFICPACHRKRVSRYAKERNLSKLGHEARAKGGLTMRLIDADKLPVVTEWCVDEAGFGASFHVVHEEDINKAPTIDPESLRPQGEWECEHETWGKMQCSVCKKEALLEKGISLYVDEKAISLLAEKGYSEKYNVAVGSMGRWGMTRIDENGEIIIKLGQSSESAYDYLKITDNEKKAIEDARYVLPNACETKRMSTLNARSLYNFFYVSRFRRSKYLCDFWN